MKIIKMENCYGIKNLNWFKKKNIKNALVYAPNGTFKSSFATAFSKWGEVCDRLNPDKKYTAEIEIEGRTYKNTDEFKNVIVYSSDVDCTEGLEDTIKELISSNVDQHSILKLKEEIGNHQKKVDGIFNKPKISKKNLELIGYNKEKYTANELIEYLTMIMDAKVITDLENTLSFTKQFPKYYDIFDEEDFQEALNLYQDKVNKKIQSDFFDEAFDEVQAEKLLKQIKSSFFLSKDKSRIIKIKDIEYTDDKELENFFNSKLEEILEDENVKVKYQAVVKILGKKSSELLNSFKKYPKVLMNLPKGKNQIIYSYIKKSCEISNEDINNAIRDLNRIKNEIEKIYERAAENKSLFEKITEEYISAFDPIFEIKIEDKKSVLIGKKKLEIVFRHKRDEDENSKKSHQEIESCLSSGQKSILRILDFMFKYEQMKQKYKEKKFLVILDDIVETFDYRNRNGFLMYIDKMIEDKSCELIIMTHNFEFFQRVKRYLGKDGIIVGVGCSNFGEVTVEVNRAISIDVSRYISNIKDVKHLLAAIPFVREVSSIMSTDKNAKIVSKGLTKALHFKEGTDNILVKDIIEYYSKMNIKVNEISEEERNEKYLIKLEEISQVIKGDKYYYLPDKIILSIASRVFLEKKYINEDFEMISGCEENQTKYLYNNYKTDKNENINKLMKKVLLYTSDFIHVNTFMYEPLVDIDPKELVELFSDIQKYTE